MCRTSSSTSGSLDEKSCSSASEESGMPCRVPVQPHSAKVVIHTLSSVETIGLLLVL